MAAPRSAASPPGARLNGDTAAPGPSASGLAAWHAMLTASTAALARLEVQLERQHRLSVAAYEVLLNLSHADGQRLRLQNLVSHTGLTKSGVSRLVDRLEAAALIETASCPSDRRGAFAVLTEQGRARLDEASRTHLQAIEELFGQHFTADEAERLTSLLARVSGALAASA